jgi:hypothetical protein
MARRFYQDTGNRLASKLIRYLSRWRDNAFNDLVDEQRDAWDALLAAAQAYVLVVKRTDKEPNA